MAVSKVVFGTTTLIDLTDSTVTADKLLSQEVAYDKAGNRITGSVVVQKYYTGSTAPSSSLGQNGDIYLKV